MKFIIKSLLFVCLLLQATSSLRRCFEADQNIILTILFLSSALIGLVGLTMQNRWLLVLFAASMSLMLVASITVYALGNGNIPLTNQLFANIRPPTVHSTTTKTTRLTDPHHAISKSKQAKLTNQTSEEPVTSSVSGRQQKIAQLSENFKLNQGVDLFGRSLLQLEGIWDQLSEETASEIVIPSQDDKNIIQLDITNKLIRKDAGQAKQMRTLLQTNPTATTPDQQGIYNNDQITQDDAEEQENLSLERTRNKIRMQLDFDQYQKVLSICIELAMQGVLALWMAALIEPSHKSLCAAFYISSNANRSASYHTEAHRKKRTRNKNQAVYNYNGIRYSIRPNTSAHSAINASMGGRSANTKTATLAVDSNFY